MRANGRPLIVTASLGRDIFALAERLRRAHYPPGRNVLPAHLTLFHALPPSCEAELRDLLSDLAAGSPPLPARLAGVIPLGRGTALAIESPDLIALRDDVADRFAGCLSAQDDHRPRLHVTVQNKVSPAGARALQTELAGRIAPRAFRIPALELHYYDGGAWQAAGSWPFRGAARRR